VVFDGRIGRKRKDWEGKCGDLAAKGPSLREPRERWGTVKNVGKGEKAMLKKLTPVLFVKEIEAVLPFWVEGLGFKKTAEVPEGDKLGFVILEKDGIELMYQTYASVDKDMPSVGGEVRKGPTFLYLQVDDLQDVKAAVKRATVYMPERKTFYGATEIGVKDPAGHFITFAQFAAAPQD
jgi:uncharacterized glyoxalase superfamily protein PhnB